MVYLFDHAILCFKNNLSPKDKESKEIFDFARFYFDIGFVCSGTVPWNKGRVEKNPTPPWTLSGISKIYKHCIKP